MVGVESTIRSPIPKKNVCSLRLWTLFGEFGNKGSGLNVFGTSRRSFYTGFLVHCFSGQLILFVVASYEVLFRA